MLHNFVESAVWFQFQKLDHIGLELRGHHTLKQ